MSLNALAKYEKSSFAFGGVDSQRELLETGSMLFEKGGTVELKKYEI